MSSLAEKYQKVPMHLLPPEALEVISLAMLNGALKYGAGDWRRSGISAAEYIGATMRHLQAYAGGEDKDPESGHPHLAHAAASLMVMLDAGFSGVLQDDRPYKIEY